MHRREARERPPDGASEARPNATGRSAARAALARRTSTARATQAAAAGLRTATWTIAAAWSAPRQRSARRERCARPRSTPARRPAAAPAIARGAGARFAPQPHASACSARPRWTAPERRLTATCGRAAACSASPIRTARASTAAPTPASAKGDRPRLNSGLGPAAPASPARASLPRMPSAVSAAGLPRAVGLPSAAGAGLGRPQQSEPPRRPKAGAAG